MMADVVLPSSAWPEKNGTVTNTNRQVQMGRKALDLPGDTRQDLWIAVELAKRLGLGWTYAHPSEVFAEMKLAMPSLDNITWERLERESSIMYPCPAPDHPGEAIVFGDGFPTRTGRARIVPADILPPAEVPDIQYPLVLITGRQLEHWHTGAMTRRAEVLDYLEPGPTASLHPSTLARYGVAAGETVRVATRRGTIKLTARADREIQEGVIFIPFAYVEAAANVLTNPQLDPIAKIPEYKYCAVRINPRASTSGSLRLIRLAPGRSVRGAPQKRMRTVAITNQVRKFCSPLNWAGSRRHAFPGGGRQQDFAQAM